MGISKIQRVTKKVMALLDKDYAGTYKGDDAKELSDILGLSKHTISDVAKVKILTGLAVKIDIIFKKLSLLIASEIPKGGVVKVNDNGTLTIMIYPDSATELKITKYFDSKALPHS